MRLLRLAAALGLLTIVSAALLLPILAHSADWGAAETEVEILVVTKNEDRSERETIVWIAVLDGDAFVRTSGTPWGRNMERDPEVVLKIAGEDHPVRAERLLDDTLVDRVQAKFREKYGFADRLARVVRFVAGGSRIYRVSPR